jgi:DnaK suppressor protein
MTIAKTLQQKLNDTTRQIQRLEGNLNEKPKQGLGRGAAWMSQWEFNRALVTRLRSRATQLRDALTRIEHGTYGVCETCGQTIHPDRLAVLPDTGLCIECARAAAAGGTQG